MLRRICMLLLVVSSLAPPLRAADDPLGFNGALWGQTPDEVRQLTGATSWQPDPVAAAFPPELEVTAFTTGADIAGYNASITYYFQNRRFFQATVDFNFNELKNFDFNYNVFRSVNEYYMAIKAKTVVFVNDIYDLLAKKYGKKKPVFKGLDPRFVFQELDRYVLQERWNMRYHPYDFYLNIITGSYARWDFQHTRVLFSLNIAAAEQRFDYTLSLSSNDLSGPVQRAMDAMRAKRL